MHRHRHGDLRAGADPHEIDMHRRVGHGVVLDIARQRAVRSAVDLDIDEMREKTLPREGARQFTRLQADRHRLLVVAIDDAGYAALAPDRARRAFAGGLARLGAEADDLGHRFAAPSFKTTAAGAGLPRPVRPASPFQSNRLETDLSSLMRSIASAIKGAIVSCRMFCDRRTASVATMLSVMTSILIGEADTRATAPPESTPCDE